MLSLFFLNHLEGRAVVLSLADLSRIVKVKLWLLGKQAGYLLQLLMARVVTGIGKMMEKSSAWREVTDTASSLAPLPPADTAFE